MRVCLVAAVLLLVPQGAKTEVRHARWDGVRFSCPAHYDIWASEPEALAGHDDYVYCIPEVSQ